MPDQESLPAETKTDLVTASERSGGFAWRSRYAAEGAFASGLQSLGLYGLGKIPVMP